MLVSVLAHHFYSDTSLNTTCCWLVSFTVLGIDFRECFYRLGKYTNRQFFFSSLSISLLIILHRSGFKGTAQGTFVLLCGLLTRWPHGWKWNIFCLYPRNKNTHIHPHPLDLPAPHMRFSFSQYGSGQVSKHLCFRSSSLHFLRLTFLLISFKISQAQCLI